MAWRVPFLRRAFVAASVAWSLALPAASLAAAEPHPSSVVYLLSFAVYLTGSLLCHQLPERSFHLWGAQMPVCARCTGIYFGAAVAAIIFAVRRGGPTWRPGADTSVGPHQTRTAPGRTRIALIVAAVPTAVTLVYEWTTGHTPANWIRAAAGVPIGAVVAWIVCWVHPEPVGG